jgi:hypothetical protein
MPIHHLVVTPLPNGRSGGTLFCSVHLSPRLRDKGVLADYPDVADWGTFVTTGPGLQFQPLINGAVRPGVAVAVTSPPVDPAVWRAVFGDPPTAVQVEPFAFLDRSRPNVTAIDSGELSRQIMALVRSLSARGAAGATKADVLAAAGALLHDTLPPARDFFGQVGNGENPSPPSPEFHDQLGPLCAHPFLMRTLGLVFDLEITLPPGAPAVNTIAVRTNWPRRVGLTAHDEVPMRVAVDADFKARVDQPDFRVSDWLALGGAKYAVGQLDLINAVQQIDQMIDDLETAPAPDSPIDVPAMLESGLSVICGDLGDVLRGRFARQRTIEDGIDAWLGGATPTPLLFAEDITLGYRCDVDDDVAPGFRSLHDRRVPKGYGFPRDKTAKVVPPADEGWGSIALTTDGSETRRPRSTTVTYHQEGEPDVDKVEARDETEWRLNDHVFTWGGWSLSTPRVGNSTTGRGTVKARERNVPAPGSPTRLIVDYAHVNGTLPKLRYGRTYTLRARCVDLAGNGPVLADVPPPDAEAPPTQFGRLAPLVAPLPVRRASRPDPGVGDLPDVLVIRSELEDTDRDVAPTDRLLFPPRIGQSRLERHGLPAGGNDQGSYDLIAERDARSLADQTLVDPETGELVAGAAIVDGDVTAGPTKPPVLYLADPVAGHAAFVGLPGGDPARPVLVPYGTWPDVEAVQLQLRSGEGAPRVSRAERRVTVRLPKGTIATAALATAPDAALLDHMALAQGLDPAALTEARRGLNPMVSPRRLVTLVHASRLPLDAPLFGPMTANRDTVGQTDVVIDGILGVHRATTEHVVIRSRWVDTIDDPADPDQPDAPFERITKRVVSDVPLAPESEDGTAEELNATSLELGDTRRRSVRLVAEGFSRFSRYFTERIDFVMGAPGNTLSLDDEGVVPSSVTLARQDGSERFTRGVHFDVTREGELSILDDGAIPRGTVCRVEFIPRPVSRLSLEAATGQDFVADVPASAAPVLPSVVAVVPAFARQVTETDTSITVDHDGRVLRLHLARPWFSSGAGELLGVAIDAPGTAEPALTRWGRDPLTGGPGPALAVATAHFPAASEVAAAVDGRFAVAGHEVAYDEERQLWTADVPVDAEIGYRPFVRLHVCRFQPLAVAGQHVSPTVELEPLRLGAQRRVEVTQVTTGRANVRLAGPDTVNVVTVVLQEADTDVADPDLRWQDVRRTILTRSGTTVAAVHEDVVDISGTGAERRLVVEDAETVSVEADGTLADATVVAYREVIEIPAGW